MSKCKDCLYYESCSTFSKIITSAVDVETGCEHFKNRKDFVEVVHGRWTDEHQGFMYYDATCSVCGKHNDSASKFCPNCGAKMDGDGNG